MMVSERSPWAGILGGLLLLLLGLALSVHFYGRTLPSFSEVNVTAPTGERFIGHLPVVHLYPPAPTERMEFTMTLPPAYPERYQLAYADKVDALVINGKAVPKDLIAPRIDLAGFLHPGPNTVSVSLSTKDAFVIHLFGIAPALSSPLHGLFAILTSIMIVLWAFFAARSLGMIRSRLLVILFFSGVLLRCMYMHGTPYFERALDWSAHIEYIRHIATVHNLPIADGVSEAHQMPLYYLLAAIPFMAGQMAGWSESQIILFLQLLSLLTSIGVFTVAMRVSEELFPSDMWPRCLFILMAAVFPSLVYLSSEISNDPLVTLLVCGWFLFAYRFWLRGGRRDWVIASILVGAACLTKASAVSAAVAAGLMLVACWFKHRGGFKEFLILICAGVPSVLLAVWRVMTDIHFGMVANAEMQQRILLAGDSVTRFFVFNPIQMLVHPYVFAPNPADRTRYFFEVAFRTSQFGNSVMAHDISILLVLALFLLPFLLIGCFRSFDHKSVPAWIMTITLWVGFIAFAAVYPYVPSQHFRYILPAVLPMSYFLVRSVSDDAPLALKTLARPVILSYVVVAFSYFAGILLVL